MRDFSENELFDIALKHKNDPLIVRLVEELQRRNRFSEDSWNSDYVRRAKYCDWRKAHPL